MLNTLPNVFESRIHLFPKPFFLIFLPNFHFSQSIAINNDFHLVKPLFDEY